MSEPDNKIEVPEIVLSDEHIKAIVAGKYLAIEGSDGRGYVIFHEDAPDNGAH